jgi:hypothetical protein
MSKCATCDGTGVIDEAALLAEPMMKSLQFPDEKGGITARISHSVVPIMAAEFIAILKENKGAVNYLEFTMSHKDHPDVGEIVVTIQKKNGFTPGEKAGAYRDVLRKIAVDSDCDKAAHAAMEVLDKYEKKT